VSKLILLNKPFGVVCQFSPSGARPTLADFIRVPHVYPAGRLDTDSEGLLVLTDDGALQARIADPRHKLAKAYWVQVEGTPTSAQLRELAAGVDLGDFVTRPAEVAAIAEPSGLWARDPPIRVRLAIPTAWLEVRIREGRNRQVRRMTAKVGLPTLRLIRHAIGPWTLAGLLPGQSREEPAGLGDPGEGSGSQPVRQPARYSPDEAGIQRSRKSIFPPRKRNRP
jgi:23S rRNA pseudouridine2457 synthase